MRRRVDLDLDVDERHAEDPGLLRDGLRFVGRDGRLLVLSHECCLSAIGFDRLVTLAAARDSARKSSLPLSLSRDDECAEHSGTIETLRGELKSIGVDGLTPRTHGTFGPLRPYEMFIGVSPRDEIAFAPYREGPHELWMAQLR